MTQVELRKNQSLLVCYGGGQILFGIWDLLKPIVSLLSGDIRAMAVKESLESEADWQMVLGIIFAVIGFTLLLRIFVGISAIRQGRGKHVSFLHVFFAILLNFLLVCSWINTFRPMIESGILDMTIDDYVMLFVDLTSFVMTMQIIIASLRIRRAEKEGIHE